MNSKTTGIWLLIAIVLFGAIVWVEKFGPQPPPGLTPLLPGFQAAQVTSVQLVLGDQREMQVVRSNGTWQLIKPIVYPAQATSIESLLHALERLAPATVIPGVEVRRRPKTDQEFGLATPQMTLKIQSQDMLWPVLIGTRTAPGDQLYVQVVGVEGVCVVDANLLKLFPRHLDDWRDTTFADLGKLRFNRVVVSNTLANLELQRDPSNLVWRLSRPIVARANNPRLGQALQRLNSTRITRFVTDDPRADLEAIGLNSPELVLTLAQDTNVVATYLFGRSPTNDSTQVYARRVDNSAIVTVPGDLLEPWRAPLNQFRDPLVVSFAQRVDQIEFRGGKPFTLRRTASNTWQAVAADFSVDAGLVDQLIATLGALEIVPPPRDSVTDADLPEYGLDAPARQVIVSSTLTNGSSATNVPLVALAFGPPKADKVYVRRADENPVYAITLADYQRLPEAAWQLRERRIWNFTEHDVVRLKTQQEGRQRELRRSGTNSWAIAPGSQGIINPFAVEEAVRRFGEMAATLWVARGAENQERFGIGTNSLTLTFELKDGTKPTVQFGGLSPEQYLYTAVKIGNEVWIFELPRALHEMLFALSIPPDPP